MIYQTILTDYATRLGDWWPLMLGSALAALIVSAVWLGGLNRRPRFVLICSRFLPPVLLLVAVVTGLTLAIRQANLVDDAFISLRYAHNLLEGHGLVYNPGEYVEGYTNFLWTLLLAAVSGLSGVELPLVALGMSLLAYIANLLAVYSLGRRLAAESGASLYVPVAAGLLAVQIVAVSYATSGLETTFGSLLVNLGVLVLISGHGGRRMAAAGLLLVASAFTRPDHGLFYVCGGLALAWRHAPGLWRECKARHPRGFWSAGLRELTAYALPFGGYLAYLAWKLWYYGDIVPNTYYAKSAALSWFSQGMIYLTTFLAGSHFHLIVPLFLIWLVRPCAGPQARDFKHFVMLALPLYTIYVVKVGGDFMFGRFFLPLVPLLLLSMESLLRDLFGRARTKGWKWLIAAPTAAVLLMSTLYGLPLIPSGKLLGGIADERTFYPVTAWFPVKVRNHEYFVGNLFYETLTARGITPVVASSAHGMDGYYSRLQLIDMRGLTDRKIAHQPLGQRGRPGHEKWPSEEYLIFRDVRFARYNPHPAKFKDVAELRYQNQHLDPWCIFLYDRELMREIRKRSPELHFIDFEAYLDRYLAEAGSKTPDELRQDYGWFRRYYFDHNTDAERQEQFEKILDAAE